MDAEPIYSYVKGVGWVPSEGTVFECVGKKLRITVRDPSQGEHFMQVGRSNPSLTRDGQLLMDKVIEWIVYRKCTPSTFIVQGVRPYASKHRNFTIVVEYA